MRERQEICEACGTSVRVDFTNDDVTIMREPATTPSPGRVTIRVGDKVVHQCKDGAFDGPD